MSDDEQLETAAQKVGLVAGMDAEQKQQFFEFFGIMISLIIAIFGLMFLILYFVMGEAGANLLWPAIGLFIGAVAGIITSLIYVKISGYKLTIKKQASEIIMKSVRKYTENITFSDASEGVLQMTVSRETPKQEVTIEDQQAAAVLDSATMDILLDAQIKGKLPEIMETELWGTKFHELFSKIPKLREIKTPEIEQKEDIIRQLILKVEEFKATLGATDQAIKETNNEILQNNIELQGMLDKRQIKRLSRENKKLTEQLEQIQEMKAQATSFIQKDCQDISILEEELLVLAKPHQIETLANIERQLNLLDKLQRASYNEKIGEIQGKLVQLDETIRQMGGNALPELEAKIEENKKRLTKLEMDRVSLEDEIKQRDDQIKGLKIEIINLVHEERKKERAKIVEEYRTENPEIYENIKKFEEMKALSDQEISQIELEGPMKIGPGAVLNELAKDSDFPFGRALVDILARNKPKTVYEIPESDLVAKILVPDSPPQFHRIEQSPLVDTSEEARMQAILQSQESSKLEAFFEIEANLPKLVIYIESRGRVEIEHRRIFNDPETGQAVEAFEVEGNRFYWGSIGNIPILIDILSLKELRRMYNYSLTLPKFFALIFNAFVFFIQTLVRNAKDSTDREKRLVNDKNLAEARADKAEKECEAWKLKNKQDTQDQNYGRSPDTGPTRINWKWFFLGGIAFSIGWAGILGWLWGALHG